jgi:hypothetical protein
MPFPTSRAGSTVDSTPTTSGEDEEDLNFHRRAFAKLMRTTEMRRKRLAESDGGDLSVSTRPATKRRAVMTAVYVDIPVLSTNVSAGISLTLIGFDSSLSLISGLRRIKARAEHLPI